MGYTHNNCKKVVIPLMEKMEFDMCSTVTERRCFPCKWFMYQVHIKANHVNVDDNYHIYIYIIYTWSTQINSTSASIGSHISPKCLYIYICKRFSYYVHNRYVFIHINSTCMWMTHTNALYTSIQFKYGAPPGTPKKCFPRQATGRQNQWVPYWRHSLSLQICSKHEDVFCTK